MKKLVVVIAAALLTMSMAVGVRAEEKAAETKKADAKKADAKKPEGKRERAVTATATVQAIDLEKRVVTLKGPKGNVFDLKVGPEARNLPQLKVGDEVTVKYYESLAFKVMKAGTAPSGAMVTEATERTKPGEKPGGAVGQRVTITATVEAIDQKTPTVTLKGPEGKSTTIKVKDRKNLVNVKVGDDVVITYTEAMAISVEKAKK